MTERKLLAEPVTREDGNLLTLESTPIDEVMVSVGGVEAYYKREEVLTLGMGDFELGLCRLGQAAFTDSARIGHPRYLSEELKK